MKAEWLSSWEFAHGANSFEIKGRPWRRKRGGGNPPDFLLEIALRSISQKLSAASGGGKEEEMNQVIQERIAALKKVMEQAGVDYYMLPTADLHTAAHVYR